MKEVLITGCSGAIGSALVPYILGEPETQLHLLIRADSREHLDRRRRSLMRYWEVDADDIGLVNRIRFHWGDVCMENLGLASGVYKELLEGLTHVIHSAGDVKLNQTRSEARASAVVPVRQILSLACSARRLRKIDVVTTVGVAGRMSGLVPEQRLTQSREFHNEYERAKAEAEESLWAAIDKGIPISIHRPSMVVGNSRSGKVIRFQVFYHLLEFLTGSRTWGILPDFDDATLDIIPADVVAHAIAISSDTSQSVGHVFHLCSGPSQSIAISDIAKQSKAYRAMFGEVPARQTHISQKAFRRLVSLAGQLPLGRSNKSLRALPYFLDYLAERVQFQNERTESFLSQFGWTIPRPEEYMDNIFAFYFGRDLRETDKCAMLSAVAD